MTISTLSVKKLVEFTRFSDKRQATFAANLRVPKAKDPDDSAGDYWIRSLSGIAAAFKQNNNIVVKQRIEALAADYEKTTREQTKTMYKRNLELLHGFEDFDFAVYRPPFDLEFLSKPRNVLLVKKVPLRVNPHHIFRFTENEDHKIGSIWFMTQLTGFKATDLGIYAESLYKYVSLLYSNEYQIDPKYCTVVDVSGKESLNYQQILSGKVPRLFDKTVDVLNKYLA